MPRNTVDLNAGLKNTIASEVQAALEPHVALLARLEAAFGSTGSAAAPNAKQARGKRKAGKVAKKRVTKAKRTAPAAAAATNLAAGQTVRYRQGRGEFEAVVTRIDANAGVVHLERVSDGKKAERPAAKVYAA